jgi:hypothetical protein
LGQVVSQIELIRYRAGWKRNWRGVVCSGGSVESNILVVAIKNAPARARSTSSQRKPESIPRMPESEGVRILLEAGHSTTGLIERIKEVRS